MEEINFSENFIETDQLDSLEKETLIGWSTACLDEAISIVNLIKIDNKLV